MVLSLSPPVSAMSRSGGLGAARASKPAVRPGRGLRAPAIFGNRPVFGRALGKGRERGFVPREEGGTACLLQAGCAGSKPEAARKG